MNLRVLQNRYARRLSDTSWVLLESVQIITNNITNRLIVNEIIMTIFTLMSSLYDISKNKSSYIH